MSQMMQAGQHRKSQQLVFDSPILHELQEVALCSRCEPRRFRCNHLRPVGSKLNTTTQVVAHCERHRQDAKNAKGIRSLDEDAAGHRHGIVLATSAPWRFVSIPPLPPSLTRIHLRRRVQFSLAPFVSWRFVLPSRHSVAPGSEAPVLEFVFLHLQLRAAARMQPPSSFPTSFQRRSDRAHEVRDRNDPVGIAIRGETFVEPREALIERQHELAHHDLAVTVAIAGA